jgi:hypothetical protein
MNFTIKMLSILVEWYELFSNPKIFIFIDNGFRCTTSFIRVNIFK